MPVRSSADGAGPLNQTRLDKTRLDETRLDKTRLDETRPGETRPVFDVPLGHRLRMVALGYVPLLHVCTVLAAGVLPFLHLEQAPLTAGLLLRTSLLGAASAAAALYLLPPILCRLAGVLLPLRSGSFDLGSRQFLAWWLSAQTQVIFNRLPVLEELLRLVPGLYSQWLRMWGSKIGVFTYWSSGVRVLDRALLEVGDRVVFGAEVVLSPHNLAPDESRRLRLLLGPIAVGDDSMIGGQAVLAPGSRVGAGELLPAFHRLAPQSEWRGGRRRRQGGADWATAAALVAGRGEAP